MGVGAAEVGSVRLTATPFGLPRTPRCACEHLVWVRPLKSCPPTFCLFWTYFLSFLSLSSVESLASALPNIRFSLSICSAFTSATCVCVCVCVCVWKCTCTCICICRCICKCILYMYMHVHTRGRGNSPTQIVSWKITNLNKEYGPCPRPSPPTPPF